MKDKIIYISGKIRDDSLFKQECNIIDAMSVALECWKLGYPTICPHGNTHLFDGELTWEEFITGDLLILDRCDIIIMVEGWQESTGAMRERQYAHMRGMESYDCFYDFLKAIEEAEDA